MRVQQGIDAGIVLARCDQDLDRHDGNIVLSTRGTAPPLDLAHHGGDTLLQWQGPAPADRLQEPGIAEHLTGGVHRLGNAIGVEIQPVPGGQSDGPLLVGVLRQTDREPCAFKDHRPSAGGKMHRAGVARGDEAKLPGPRVQHPVDHRRELLGRRVEGEELVQAVGKLGGRSDCGPIRDVSVTGQDRGRVRRGGQDTAQRYRQQCSRDAVAADVEDVQRDPPSAERYDVQAVTGQFVAGPIDPGEGRARNAGQLAR